MYRAGYCHDADVSIFSTIQLFSSLAALAYHNAQLEASAFRTDFDPEEFEDLTLPKTAMMHKARSWC